MNVTDAMVDTALGILFPLNAAYNEGAHERLKAKIRNALEAALSHAAGQEEYTFAFWNIFKDGKHAAFLSPKSGYPVDSYMEELREINPGVEVTARSMYYGPDTAIAAQRKEGE